jgi:hypothetical protein
MSCRKICQPEKRTDSALSLNHHLFAYLCFYLFSEYVVGLVVQRKTKIIFRERGST